jgi:hypothetical protein
MKMTTKTYAQKINYQMESSQAEKLLRDEYDKFLKGWKHLFRKGIFFNVCEGNLFTNSKGLLKHFQNQGLVLH